MNVDLSDLAGCQHTSFTAIDWKYSRPINPEGNVYICNRCCVIGQFTPKEPFGFIELDYGVMKGRQIICNMDQMQKLVEDNPGENFQFANLWSNEW